jgi:hypothetical protein
VTVSGPTISVAATGANAAEPIPPNIAAVSGTFTVTRTGLTTEALTVNYSLGGTALNGADYQTTASSVVIPSGSSSATVVITPLADTIAEGTETAILSVAADPLYQVAGSGSAATISIADRPVDDWRFGMFGAQANNPAIAGDTADPDGDGLPNLVEYALGTNPNAYTPLSDRPVLALQSGTLSLTYKKDVSTAKPDIQYKVQKSPHMADGTWSKVEVDAGNGIAAGTHVCTGTQGTIETWRGSVPVGANKSIFLRLKIMPPDPL